MVSNALRSAEPDAATRAESAATRAATSATIEPPSTFELLGLSLPTTRVILVFFIAVHAVLAFADDEPRAGLLLEVPAFIAVAVAAYGLVQDVGLRMSARRARGILALCGITMLLMFFQVSPRTSSPFAQWHLGAITMVLLVMALRGRVGVAWFGYAAMAVITICWAVVNGLGVADGINLVIRHAGTLLAGTLVAVRMQRTTHTLAALNTAHFRRAEAEATQTAAISERKAQLDHINALARPALERLANQHEPGDAERADCLLVEAGLRDAMRARALCLEPLTSAARRARARGIEVILLDDSGDQPLFDVESLARLVAAELDGLHSGRLTARVLPPGRAEGATVVIEADDHRMISVLRNGTVVR